MLFDHTPTPPGSPHMMANIRILPTPHHSASHRPLTRLTILLEKNQFTVNSTNENIHQSGDLSGAEATCSQLLGTPGLARPLRQKASYRRAMARQRQVDMEGTTEDAGSRLARKAYRDAYLSVKLSQVSRSSTH